MSNSAQSKTLDAVDFHGNKYNVSVDKLRWRPSVYAIVVHGGKILLTRQGGSYHLPGGGMEFGEMPEAALVRETFEETGIKVASPRLIACKSNVFKGLRADDIEEFFQSILLFYACDYESGELSISGLDDHEQTWTEMPEWVPLEKFDTLKLGSSYEWRDVVRKVVDKKSD
jgi:ADP-ribose pyrophosphatase YjhB (NUDIX family)